MKFVSKSQKSEFFSILKLTKNFDILSPLKNAKNSKNYNIIKFKVEWTFLK